MINKILHKIIEQPFNGCSIRKFVFGSYFVEMKILTKFYALERNNLQTFVDALQVLANGFLFVLDENRFDPGSRVLWRTAPLPRTPQALEGAHAQPSIEERRVFD